ncbi:hypothetical protein DRE_00247 [Drechslerella stenobrocha 248]|uniref:Uncharacterized protein n=1 Tax=Drechslerella stenobrocha 248 TaxID=1043628 RepID=W7I9Z3_9PEZI|nr:hypothetical protein DRE_00247 [Drechslerella stenobrocha 248]
MPKFKKFASKLFDRALEGLETLSAEAAAKQQQQRQQPMPSTAPAAPAAARAPAAVAQKPFTVEVDPVEWVSHCTHTAGICPTCLTAVKTCIQFAVDSGLPGGFNFATGQLDPDVAECNNSCPHKGLNDCCASCLCSSMSRQSARVRALADISSAAVGHLNSAAMGVGATGSGIGALRQNLHQQSVQTEAQRAVHTQQRMMMMSSPVVLGGASGGGGGTWGRQQQLANGMVWDPPVYTTNSAYSQFRW